LYKKLNYEEFKTAEKVFKYGDLGRKFYIIITGSVYVLLRKDGIVDYK